MFVGKFWWGGANAGLRYEGGFQGGLRHGQGKMVINAKGQVSENGKWENL